MARLASTIGPYESPVPYIFQRAERDERDYKFPMVFSGSREVRTWFS